MDATPLENDPTSVSVLAETGLSSIRKELPDDVQAWLAQPPSDLIARWRMEILAGLRDEDGRLTCAKLHVPQAPLSEARRIADTLMEPKIRTWLASPPKELLRGWKPGQ